jgi:hypothetical protein
MVFGALERLQSRISFLNKWDPRKLPRTPRRKDRVPRVNTVFELVFSVIYVIWWLGLPRYGHLMFGPLCGTLMLNPALRGFFLPVLIPTLLLITQQSISLFRPQWTWLRPAAMMVSHAVALGILESIAMVYPYVLLSSEARDPTHYAHALFIVNQVILWSVIWTALAISMFLVVYAFQTVQAIRRLAAGPRNGAALQATQTL